MSHAEVEEDMFQITRMLKTVKCHNNRTSLQNFLLRMKMQEMTPQWDTHNGRQIQFASQWEMKLLQLFSSQ